MTRRSPARSRADSRLHELIDGLSVAAYTCDPAGRITHFNQPAVRLWGRTPALNDPSDRFCGSFRLHSIDGAPISHEACWMALALKNDIPYHGCEVIVERPSGARANVLAHAHPLHDRSGRQVGAVNVLVEVSEPGSASEQLEGAPRVREERLREITVRLEPVVARLRKLAASVAA